MRLEHVPAFVTETLPSSVHPCVPHLKRTSGFIADVDVQQQTEDTDVRGISTPVLSGCIRKDDHLNPRSRPLLALDTSLRFPKYIMKDRGQT